MDISHAAAVDESGRGRVMPGGTARKPNSGHLVPAPSGGGILAKEIEMRSLRLFFLGVPIPIIILIALFMH